MSECPGESRIREAAAVNGVEALVVACPKDVTIYQDAVKPPETRANSRSRI